ncbi:MAG: EamA family transporter [Saprospiraceae bacterium]|nr:EamA family transporter [Saprospiraceae bacterium]
MGLAAVIWFYVLKKFEFGLAYPMISISYVFALLVSVIIFKETIPLTRYLGVSIIIIGVIILFIK